MDQNLYYQKTKETALVNMSDTLEELGQIKYIFSDKTGTLTENEMKFLKCAVGKKVYTRDGDYLLYKNNKYNSKNFSKKVLNFFKSVCICHSVELEIVNKRNSISDFKYKSVSPDEVALLDVSRRFGVIYMGECDNIMTIRINNYDYRYQIIHVLKFDPVRKRMSLIVKCLENNSILLICKGADSHVLPRCFSSKKQEMCFDHIASFSKGGLRTLAFAVREFKQEEFAYYFNLLKEAELDLFEREKMLSNVYDKIENFMTPIGATGVEDKLQKGVEKTIKDLRTAGIKIWVLTGDKEETAISISLNCGHFNDKMNIFYLTEKFRNIHEVLLECVNKIHNFPLNDHGLVIDGFTLDILIKNYKYELQLLFSVCSATLCCRLTPLQKSQVVNFVRLNLKGSPITLAIGDGANDCSMIQEAHIGVGIIGKEGRQAVYSSDFAIHRFRFLKKLILFHGFNCYIRITMTILYFFYKNVILVTPMFVYLYFTGFTPVPIYEDLLITIYNTLITAFPIIFYSILEQRSSLIHIMNNPNIYKTLKGNNFMSWFNLIYWFFIGIWQGIIIFYVCFLMIDKSLINISSQKFDQNSMGMMAYTYVVICSTFQIQIMTRHWTLHSIITTAGSLIYFSICASLFSVVYAFNPASKIFAIKFATYYSYFKVMNSSEFWVGFIIIIPIAFLPYILMEFYHNYKNDKVFKGFNLSQNLIEFNSEKNTIELKSV